MTDASPTVEDAPTGGVALVVAPSQTRQTFFADQVQTIGIPNAVELIALRMEVVALGRFQSAPESGSEGEPSVQFHGPLPVQFQMHDIAHMRVSLDAALQTATGIFQIAVGMGGREPEALIADLQQALRDAR